MEKSKEVQIYIIGHKEVDYGYWDNSIYTPLQVGGGMYKQFLPLRDNTGDNIAEWNPIYAENTGIYWLWKNRPYDTKYVGVCQYRRRLEFEEDTDFDKWFEKYDVLAASPLFLKDTLAEHYSKCHSEDDFQMIKNILADMYPEYLEDFEEKLIKGHFLFYSNSFVMRAADFDKYCEWLFSILQEFRNRRNWAGVQDAKEDIVAEMQDGLRRDCDGKGNTETMGAIRYQQQVFGFLSERLLTLYLQHNFATPCAHQYRIGCKGYKKYEGV